MSELAVTEPRAKAKRRYRETILEAAVEVFSEKGYQNAQMGEIALKAQVAVGTLYNFFTNKENLYREMLMSHVVDIAMEFNEIFESDDAPYAKLMRYIRHKGEVLESDPKLVRLYFSEVQAVEMSARAAESAEFREIYRKMMRQMAETFKEGMKQGVFVQGDPFAMAIALSSITNAFIRLWMNHPELRPSYLERVDSMARIFFGPVLKEFPAAGETLGAQPDPSQGGSQP